MNSYIFTIGVGVDDRPQRWLGICSIYAELARGLIALGHYVEFIVNPLALDREALNGLPAEVGDHETLRSRLENKVFDFAFIWGGRIEPDKITREIIDMQGITCIFSELGWFPQQGTVYFDLWGTNSKISRDQLSQLSFWQKLKFYITCRKFANAQYGRGPFWYYKKLGPSPLRVFVPLQDETDTNITEDSPFSRMDDLISFLSRTYPEDIFVVRLHPRAEPPFIGDYPNVYFQDVAVNPVKALKDFDLVIGINSTLLTEAAFLRHRVACFGNGLAKLYELTAVLDTKRPPTRLQDIVDPGLRIEAFNYLWTVKQLTQDKLSDPKYLRSTYLNEMLNLNC